ILSVCELIITPMAMMKNRQPVENNWREKLGSKVRKLGRSHGLCQRNSQTLLTAITASPAPLDANTSRGSPPPSQMTVNTATRLQTLAHMIHKFAFAVS